MGRMPALRSAEAGAIESVAPVSTRNRSRYVRLDPWRAFTRTGTYTRPIVATGTQMCCREPVLRILARLSLHRRAPSCRSSRRTSVCIAQGSTVHNASQQLILLCARRCPPRSPLGPRRGRTWLACTFCSRLRPHAALQAIEALLTRWRGPQRRDGEAAADTGRQGTSEHGHLS